MRSLFIRYPLVIAIFLMMFSGDTTAQSVSLGEKMSEAARDFLGTLRPPQKDTRAGKEHALFEFDNTSRKSMNYLVPSVFRRRGLPLRYMNKNQQASALTLLKTSLGDKGVLLAEQVRVLEDFIASIKEVKSAEFIHDPQAFYFSIYGNPPSKVDEKLFVKTAEFENLKDVRLTLAQSLSSKKLKLEQLESEGDAKSEIEALQDEKQEIAKKIYECDASLNHLTSQTKQFLSKGAKLPNAWGWRYEGHHTSLHWTVTYSSADGEIVVNGAPQFFGAQPKSLRPDDPAKPDADWIRSVRKTYGDTVVGLADGKLFDFVEDFDPHKKTVDDDRVFPELKTRRLRFHEMTKNNLSVLEEERAAAIDFIQTLSEEELDKAHYATLFDIETNDVFDARRERRKEFFDNRGVSWQGLDKSKQDALLEILKLYVDLQPLEIRKRRNATIDSAKKFGDIVFFFMGEINHFQKVKEKKTLNLGAIYYRVRGFSNGSPLFEVNYHDSAYDSKAKRADDHPLSNDMRLRDHRHAVWRDLDRDWGQDLLRDHLKKHHSADLKRLIEGISGGEK